MNKNLKILLLNLPSLPRQRLWRDTAGGFGTAVFCRSDSKHSIETSLNPFLPYASSILLNAGYEFKVIDCQRSKMAQREVLPAVKKENPDIIFSIISLPSIKNDIKLLNKIKESIPNVITVGVGTVCRVIPTEVLQKSKIDIAMRDSYPYVSHMADLIQSLHKPRKLETVGNISYKRNNRIIHAPEMPEPDVGDLPPPCYDFLQLDGYQSLRYMTGEQYSYVPIIDSKGCPHSCAYCPYPLGFGRKVTFRSPKAIVDEMEYLHSTYNIKGFLFRGQSSVYNEQRTIELCEEINKRKLDVRWFCESRVDEVSRKILNIMGRAGCRQIYYGVETGDPKIIKIAKPGVRLKTTIKAFRLTREANIFTQANIIIGWPNDNYESLENTRKFVLKLEPDILNLNFLTPYPGTKIYEIAKKSNLILTNDWSNYTSHKVILRTKTLNANELREIKKKIIRDFYKHKLKQLLRHDFATVKKPQILINKARYLADRLIFPQD
jgi:anaerobic magnesium-protoporphyrin IX monomethyl ester cyclase